MLDATGLGLLTFAALSLGVAMLQARRAGRERRHAKELQSRLDALDEDEGFTLTETPFAFDLMVDRALIGGRPLPLPVWVHLDASTPEEPVAPHPAILIEIEKSRASRMQVGALSAVVVRCEDGTFDTVVLKALTLRTAPSWSAQDAAYAQWRSVDVPLVREGQFSEDDPKPAGAKPPPREFV